MVIGVTGKSGSGKSEFSRRLANLLNAKHIDIDKVVHKEIEKNHSKICELLDIPKTSMVTDIGEIIFTNREKYNLVVGLVWTPTLYEIEKLMGEHDRVVLDHILLPHMGSLWERCELKYLIECERTLRYKRIFKRDGISLRTLKLRESASIEYQENMFDRILTEERIADIFKVTYP